MPVVYATRRPARPMKHVSYVACRHTPTVQAKNVLLGLVVGLPILGAVLMALPNLR